MSIDVKYLKEILDYNESTGIFTWKVKRNSFGGKVAPGAIAGSKKDGGGYIRIVIDQKKHYAHRLAFLYVHGYIPNVIDHLNGNTFDNRIENLEDVTTRRNVINSKKRKTNKSGLTGVCFSKRDKMWIANIKVNYKGCCFWTKDFFEAICWRKSMEFKYGYEQAKRMR